MKLSSIILGAILLLSPLAASAQSASWFTGTSYLTGPSYYSGPSYYMGGGGFSTGPYMISSGYGYGSYNYGASGYGGYSNWQQYVPAHAMQYVNINVGGGNYGYGGYGY